MTAAVAHHDVIADLSRRFEQALRPLVPPGTPCALLHFPSSGNAGDNAIWLGEAALLRRLGARIVYACEVATYSRERLAARLGTGVILLQGGGNLGDLWPSVERLREEVIAAFPDHPIIQLPQTIHFRDAANVARVRAIFDGHPRLVLLLRDARSLEFARNEFKTTSLLCPDAAFALGPLPRPAPPTADVVCLMRTDQESRGYAADLDLLGGVQVDWRVERFATRGVSHAVRFAAKGMRGVGHRPDWAWTGLVQAYNQVARLRLSQGCRTLAAARCVVTDRLHGHILSVLLGIPHVVLDNNYGKVRSFYDTWTKGCDLVDWAESPADAAGRLATRGLAGGAFAGQRGDRSWSQQG